jgi:hypothetical protein
MYYPAYNFLNDLSRNYLSSNELYDRLENKIIRWLIRKAPIRNAGLITLSVNVIKIALVFVSVIYLSNNI